MHTAAITAATVDDVEALSFCFEPFNGHPVAAGGAEPQGLLLSVIAPRAIAVGRKWGRSGGNRDATQLARSGADPKGRGAGCIPKPGDHAMSMASVSAKAGWNAFSLPAAVGRGGFGLENMV